MNCGCSGNVGAQLIGQLSGRTLGELRDVYDHSAEATVGLALTVRDFTAGVGIGIRRPWHIEVNKLDTPVRKVNRRRQVEL